MGIQALRERKDELAKQANNMIANAGDKVWSKEEAAAYDQMTDEIGASMRRSRQSPTGRPRRRKMIGEAAKNSKENDHASRCGRAVLAQRHEPERSGTGDGAKRHVHNDRFGRWLHRANRNRHDGD